METIHTRLRKIREDLRLSERGLAQRLVEEGPDDWSVTHTTISNYEDGTTRSVPHEFLAAISSVSGYRIEWIVNGNLPKKRTDPDDDALKLDVIGMVYNEEIDALAIRQFAKVIREKARDDAGAQIGTEAPERGVELQSVEPEENDGPGEDDPPEDPPTEDTNGPPNTTRHAGP